MFMEKKGDETNFSSQHFLLVLKSQALEQLPPCATPLVMPLSLNTTFLL